MRHIAIGIVCVLLAAVGVGQKPKASAKPSVCKGNPDVVGSCFRVHGRAFIALGTPPHRIWPVGTKRILGITGSAAANDAEAPIAPRHLLAAFHLSRNNPYGDLVYGDFEVCPFTPERRGEMQMVCVESAEHLVVK
jgi:hypothetical protein